MNLSPVHKKEGSTPLASNSEFSMPAEGNGDLLGGLHQESDNVDERPGEIKPAIDHQRSFEAVSKDELSPELAVEVMRDSEEGKRPQKQSAESLRNLDEEKKGLEHQHSRPDNSLEREEKANKNGTTVEISFADIQLRKSLAKGKADGDKNASNDEKDHPLPQTAENSAADRPMSGLIKSGDQAAKGSVAAKNPLKPDRYANSPFRKTSGLNLNGKLTNTDSNNANTKSSTINRAPPPRAKKFYEKMEPSKITDLNSTSMFKNGILGGAQGRSVSTGQNRYKKKSHLRRMEEILQAESSKNIFKSDEDEQRDSGRGPKIDLFFKRYTKLPMRFDRIDHDEIKVHSTSVKVAQLEAERLREERRKRFVGHPYPGGRMQTQQHLGEPAPQRRASQFLPQDLQ